MHDFVRSKFVRVSLLALSCAAAQACGGTAETSSPGQGLENTATASAPLYRESLGNGAEMIVHRIGEHGAAIGVSLPEAMAAAMNDRLMRADSEETVEGYYRALTGGERTLPASLEDLALRVRTASKQPPVYAEMPANVPEGSFSGADPAGDIGSIQQALGADDTWDWNGDASWFRTNYCKKDSVKRLTVECITNWTAVATSLWGYYHLGTGMAASFNGTASFSVHRWVCGASCSWVEYTNLRTTIQPRWLQTWSFLGDETYLFRQFKTVGNGPTPRVHQSVSVGYPKINSFSVTPSQTTEYAFTAKLTGFKPGLLVDLYYDNPVAGARRIGGGYPSADSTLTISDSRLSCGSLLMRVGAPYWNGQTIRATGADGRSATYTTNSLYSACF